MFEDERLLSNIHHDPYRLHYHAVSDNSVQLICSWTPKVPKEMHPNRDSDLRFVGNHHI